MSLTVCLTLTAVNSLNSISRSMFLAGLLGTTNRMTTSMSVPLNLSHVNGQVCMQPVMGNQSAMSNSLSYQPGFATMNRSEPFGEQQSYGNT
jgi:hypothetical protein